jgi:hypothetical protein
MATSLTSRLEKLEQTAQILGVSSPKIVRLVVSEDEERDVYREAEALGLDTSPASNDVFIIRLIRPAIATPGEERENPLNANAQADSD